MTLWCNLRFLAEEVCGELIKETMRCAKECGLRLGQITTDLLGISHQIHSLMYNCILPMLNIEPNSKEASIESCIFYECPENQMFPEYSLTFGPDPTALNSENFELKNCYTIPDHQDDSDITVNICLGGNFQESSVVFRDKVEVFHKASHGIAHSGKARHFPKKTEGGDRFNLLIFYSKRA
eukprot:TRINITY_DN3625_c0_g1_i1.p1 TRINITY_DN3625_c0_g1~~TRINITY_DN3625_c0_g1_i1.p1  ORF type:complete len:181 (-),score=28.32 TRINITY_DN3625_c0_g1_i1:147-689(-)